MDLSKTSGRNSCVIQYIFKDTYPANLQKKKKRDFQSLSPPCPPFLSARPPSQGFVVAAQSFHPYCAIISNTSFHVPPSIRRDTEPENISEI